MSQMSGAAASRPVFLGSLLSVLDSSGDLPPVFEDLRVRFDTVKAHYDAGELTPERFAGMISTLRCYDGNGVAWTIGATSGLWYRMTDDGWLQSPPPYSSVTASSAAASLYQTEEPWSEPVEIAPTARSAPDPISSPSVTGADAASADTAAAGEDDLLFGLPVQLFDEDPAPAGPVPYGALPGDGHTPGDIPPGDIPPGDIPPGDIPPGDIPPGDIPSPRRHAAEDDI